jgi:hypothetical protein
MPHIHITHSEKGDNKGSCRELVAYLEKENQQNQPNQELWFNQNRSDIKPGEVQSSIDQNVSKLKKTEAKFFLVNISPSTAELAHIGSDPEKLKAYGRQVMEAYAQNFQKGLGANDLVYFGKVEYNRSYKYTDPEVKAGQAKRGELKEGAQMHIQIIVSRKDADNKRLLSPLNNSSGRNQEHSAKFGQFNHINFKKAGEQAFDQSFGYQRSFEERFEYLNMMKNGKPLEKAQIQLEKQQWNKNQNTREELEAKQEKEMENQKLNQPLQENRINKFGTGMGM